MRSVRDWRETTASVVIVAVITAIVVAFTYVAITFWPWYDDSYINQMKNACESLGGEFTQYIGNRYECQLEPHAD